MKYRGRNSFLREVKSHIDRSFLGVSHPENDDNNSGCNFTDDQDWTAYEFHASTMDSKIHFFIVSSTAHGLLQYRE